MRQRFPSIKPIQKTSSGESTPIRVVSLMVNFCTESNSIKFPSIQISPRYYYSSILSQKNNCKKMMNNGFRSKVNMTPRIRNESSLITPRIAKEKLEEYIRKSKQKNKINSRLSRIKGKSPGNKNEENLRKKVLKLVKKAHKTKEFKSIEAKMYIPPINSLSPK